MMLLADEDQFVALIHGEGQQCRANRNGSVVHADVVDASSHRLKNSAKQDKSVYFSKTKVYRLAKLFTGDRALVVPLQADWHACIPTALRKHRSSVSSLASKNIVLGVKAISWIGGGIFLKKLPKTAYGLVAIGSLYVMQLLEIPPWRLSAKLQACSGQWWQMRVIWTIGGPRRRT